MTHPLRFTVVTGFVALFLAAVVWLVASYANGRLLAREIDAFSEQPTRPMGVAVQDIRHESSVLSSRGSFELRLMGGCTKRDRARAPILRVDYEVDHVPTLDSPLRVRWRARPLRVLGRSLGPLLGERTVLEGTLARGYDGTYRSQFRVLPLTAHSEIGALELSDGHGTLTLGKQSLRLAASLHHARLQLGGSDLELKDLALNWSLSRRGRGVGTTSSRVQLLRNEGVILEQAQLTTRGTEQPGRLELQVGVEAAGYQQAEIALHDLSFTGIAHNLEPQSFEEVLDLAGNGCGPLALFGEASPALQAALHSSFGRDFSVEVARLRANADDGALDGAARIEVARTAPDTDVALTARIRSSGQLNASGATLTRFLLTPRWRGAFRATDTGVHADYTFEQRSLQLNGQIVSPMAVDATLRIVDQLLESL